MVSLNKVILAGRLTQKPKLRTTPSGMPVTDLLLAINREFTTASGERQQESCFVDIVVWGKQAEYCTTHLETSSSVLVEGRLQLDVWYSKEGDKRCKLRVAAERVQFLDRYVNRDKEEQYASQCANSQ